MEELRSAINAHMDQMADLVEKLTAELRSGLKPAYENLMGFFHSIDWKIFLAAAGKSLAMQLMPHRRLTRFLSSLKSMKIHGFEPWSFDTKALFFAEPWLICLIFFHVFLLLLTFASRKNINFQMCLFFLALGGVYLAETLNRFLAGNWRSFAGQNYFDLHGLFLSVLWSGPLLVIAILILVNTLFSMCHLIVRWKRSELRHRARAASNKED